MSPRPFALALLAPLAIAVLGACSEARTAAPPAAAPDPAPATSAAEEPAVAAPSEPSPVLAILRAASAVEPTGPAPLAAEGETVVDPAATFEIELAAPVPDVRLVLLDAQEAHVAGESAREVGATTRLSLAPAAPLVPGSRYVLRLEGLAAREVRDAGDRAFLPQAFTVLVAGEPPPPEPKKPARRAKARRN